MRLPDIESLIENLVAGLRTRLAARERARTYVIGVRTGGVWIAERVRAALALHTPLGTIDISFHRDDYGRVGLNPSVHPTQLPWDVEDKHVVLVDDVLYTGRTVRAALNEIFDWGRPASVALGVLVSRDGRELPVQADAAGAVLELPPGRHLKLHGPTPLRLELVDAAGNAVNGDGGH